MAWIGGALSAAGSGASGLGGKYAANSQANALDYSGKLHEQNAGIIDDQTRADVKALQKNIYRSLGAQRAAAAASGVGVEGSVLDVLEEASQEGALDVQRRAYQGELAKRNEMTAGKLDKYYARSSRESGVAMGASGGLRAAGSAWSGLSSSGGTKGSTSAGGSGLTSGAGGGGDSLSNTYSEV